MRQLLGELFITRLEVALEIALPILIVGLASGVILYGFIYLGRRIERFEWRRELKNGTRLGQIIQIQLKERDERIRQLVLAVKTRENQTELLENQQKQLIGLAHKMNETIFEVNIEKLKRRRVWDIDKKRE